MRKRYIAVPAAIFALAAGGWLFAQSSRLEAGVQLYGQGRWDEAVSELRRAQSEAKDGTTRGEAQFWIALSELSAGRYQESLRSFDEITRLDPSSQRRVEAAYQKGRACFYLGMYNEAIVLFRQFADGVRGDTRDAYNRKSSAIYWIGECLYNLRQWDKAMEMFEIVIKQYPSSTKHETSQNRIALIKQKQTEEGLIDIIKLSERRQATPPPVVQQQPAPAPVPVYEKQGETRAYNDAVLAYKNSIAPFLQTQPQPSKPSRNSPAQDQETLNRLLNIKTQALELMDRFVSTVNTYETIDVETWEY